MAAFARREGNRSIDIKISDGRKNVSAGSCYGCWMHIGKIERSASSDPRMRPAQKAPPEESPDPCQSGDRTKLPDKHHDAGVLRMEQS
jgi:hypothetical protein